MPPANNQSTNDDDQNSSQTNDVKQLNSSPLPNDQNLAVHRQIQTDEKLPQDFDSPYSEPDDAVDPLPPGHQLLDNQSNIDSDESYQKGIDTAAVNNLPSMPKDNNQSSSDGL